MISTNLFLKNNIQNKNLKKGLSKNFSKKFEKIFYEIRNDIKDSNKTLNVLSNKINFTFKLKDLNKFKKYKTIALIGMGGSILGAEAIYQFLSKKIKKKLYFFDDLDQNKIINFKKKENLSKTLFIIISKSGNTIETLSNAFLLNLIKKNSKNVIVISEKNNNLFLIAKKLNLFFIEHRSNVGGRYSVLSEVGIVPAYLMGVNINKIRSKILNYLEKKNKFFLKDSSIKIADLMRSKNKNNLIFLNYCPELKKFLYWCQQLIAESLGKKNNGFLPSISNAPKDHHSLLQLYLDGPKDKFFNIFSLDGNTSEKIRMNKNNSFNKFLNKKTISKIKKAQKDSLIKIFQKNNIPFREFRIKKINEETLGEIISIFIIETIVIGKLLKINPYNQPAVEQVKILTKRLLS